MRLRPAQRVADPRPAPDHHQPEEPENDGRPDQHYDGQHDLGQCRKPAAHPQEGNAKSRGDEEQHHQHEPGIVERSTPDRRDFGGRGGWCNVIHDSDQPAAGGNPAFWTPRVYAIDAEGVSLLLKVGVREQFGHRQLAGHCDKDAELSAKSIQALIGRKAGICECA